MGVIFVYTNVFPKNKKGFFSPFLQLFFIFLGNWFNASAKADGYEKKSILNIFPFN